MQVEIKTEKATILLVKVAPDASNFRACDVHSSDIVYDTELNVWNRGDATIPYTDFEIVGLVKDLTEEQWVDVVPCELIGGVIGVGWEWLYPDYGRSNCDGFETAAESGLSLLTANKVYLVNPFGKKPVNSEFYWGYLDDLKQWQEAEERTGNWVLIKNL